MIIQPDRYISAFKKAGADVLTVHYEACPHLHRTIQAIQAEGMKAGVALNPHTPVSVLEDVIQDIDVVLIMSVNPGFGGQKFIPEAINKVKELNQIKTSKNLNFIIEVDGGVNSDNAPQLSEAGANALVAGSFVFNSNDPLSTIHSLSLVWSA